MKLKHCLALSLSVFLAACGGGGDDPPNVDHLGLQLEAEAALATASPPDRAALVTAFNERAEVLAQAGVGTYCPVTLQPLEVPRCLEQFARLSTPIKG